MVKSSKLKAQSSKAKNRAITECTEILFAGFGGQGIMFMGKLMAQAGLEAGRNVTWMPSYGAEVRGGTAYSMTKISVREIASPIVINPDILVVMNKPSQIKYEPKLKPGGILISNKSLIDEPSKRKDARVLNIPMTEIASRIGNTRCANMVAIGALIKSSKLFPLRTAISSLKSMLGNKEELFSINKKALEKGYSIVK